MRRTLLILSVVLLSATVFAWVLTRRLISTWHPEQTPVVAASSSTDRAPLTSGQGLTLQFSDRPIAMPALTLTDVSGAAIPPTRWKGKVVLINFWATWCGPCREEIPALVALQQQYADTLLVLGLSIDERPAADVRQFAEQYKVNYPVAIVGDDVQQAFGGIPAVPSTFVVSPAGQMVTRHVGALDIRRTEQEVRVLANLPSQAVVETVADTGQVFLSNAAFATSIPGVDLSHHSPAGKQQALTRMNTERCTCGCGLTVAQCRINDPSCDVSLPQAKKIAEEATTARTP